MRRPLVAAAIAAVMATPASAVTQQLVSIDFQPSVDNDVPLFSGQEPVAAAASPAFAGANVWNGSGFEFGPNVGGDDPRTEPYVFGNLLNSDGVSTSVGLKLGKDAFAWEVGLRPGFGDRPDHGGQALHDSYLFVGGSDETETDDAKRFRPLSLEFEIFGLDHGGSYALYFHAAKGNDPNHSGFVTLDEDGDADLADETGRLLENDWTDPTDVFYDLVTAGSDGRIVGRFDVRDVAGDVRDELNVAGLQIARVQPIPLPAGAALLPAALGLALALRGRRR
ncbi:MAG: hypothetical protein AAF192_15215 [Pseudomonadota bacterium]